MAQTNKLQNLAAAFSNAKTRNVLLTTLGVLGFAVLISVLGFYIHSRSKVPTTAQTEALPDIQSIPGISPESQAYQQAQQQQNAQQAQQAEKTGGSAVATFTNTLQSNGSDQNSLAGPGQNGLNGTSGGQPGVAGVSVGPNGIAVGPGGLPVNGQVNGQGQPVGQNPATKQPEHKDTAHTLTGYTQSQMALAASNPTQFLANDNSPTAQQFKQFQKQLAAQQLQAAEELASQNAQGVAQNTKAMQAAMGNQSKALLSDWNVPTQQYVPGSNPDSSSVQAGAAAANGGKSAPPAGPPIFKSGDIAYAVLDTAVNTDEPGPVLATIAGGRYQGAKLVGTIQPLGSQYAEKVVLSFNTLSIPSQPTSFSINAVAVDPNTSRTALASSVNNHYIERWGTLLASAFLEGYGSAVASSGSTQYYYPAGASGGISGFSVINNKTTEQQISMAFGQVGQTMGEQLGNYFNRPPTIKVAAGSAIGILFMQDVSLPTPSS